jgi:nucleoid-associated protein YgaU
MITDDSRYVNADRQFVTSHAYTAQGKTDLTQDGKVAVHSRDTLYLLTTGFGEFPKEARLSQYGDTFTSIAEEGLQDPTLWWVVADANPQIRHPFDLKPGDPIRIPR